MANIKKTLPSGAELEVQLASFEECKTLLKAVMIELESVKIDLGNIKSLKNLSEQDATPELMNTIKNAVVRLVGSSVVESCLWPCMSRCLYRNRKITSDTFEPAEARADYLLVAKEVLVVNLSPFFRDVASLLSGLKVTASGIRK